MKKIIVLIMVLILTLTISGCESETSKVNLIEEDGHYYSQTIYGDKTYFITQEEVAEMYNIQQGYIDDLELRIEELEERIAELE